MGNGRPTAKAGLRGRARQVAAGAGSLLSGRNGRFLFPLAVVVVVLSGFRSMLFGLTTCTIGRHMQYSFDADAHIWQYWWVTRQLERGEPVWQSSFVTHPFVLDLKSIWGGHLDLLLGLPLVGLLGPVGTTNVVMALMLVGSALGVYFLAAAVSGSRLGGALGALLYALSPTVLWELRHGRVEEFACGFTALAFLMAGRYIAHGRLRHLAWTLFWLGVSGLAWLGSLLLTAFALGALLAGYLLWMRLWGGLEDGGERVPGRRELVRRGATLAGALLALAAPFLLYTVLGVGGQWASGAEATELARRAEGQWLLSIIDSGVPFSRMFEWSCTTPHSGAGLTLGLAASLSLLAPGVLRRRAVPWLLASLLFVVLAAGPVLLTAPWGGTTAFPHEQLAMVVPFFKRFHYANRFMLMGNVCLGVLAAVGISGLARHLVRGTGWRGTGLFPAVLLLLLALRQVSFLFPLAVGPVRSPVHELYEKLVREGEPGILLLHDGEEGSSPEIAQMRHGMPLCCRSMPDGMRPGEMEEAQKRSPLFTFLGQKLHPNLALMSPCGSLRRDRLVALGLWDGHATDFLEWRDRYEDRVMEGTPVYQELLDDDPAVIRELGYSHVVVVRGRTGLRTPYVSLYRSSLHKLLRHHFGEPVVDDQREFVHLTAYEMSPPAQ
jgi:hypothetical protein